jgi:hypothetical protein
MNIATILLESNTQFTPMKTSDMKNLEIEGKTNATTWHKRRKEIYAHREIGHERSTFLL